MMEPITYYLKANLLIAIFMVIYVLLFRKETYFHLNRYFLLFGIAAALLIPALKISNQTIEALPIPVNHFDLPDLVDNSMVFVGAKEGVQKPESISLFAVLKMFYWAGVVVFGIRFLLFLVKLQTLIKRGVLRRIGFTFFVASNAHVQAFSFFNFVFYNNDSMSSRDFETIIEHEKIHVKQLHSVDLLITEILLVLFWFNPFVFLLRNAVRANHEFLADAAVIKRGTDKVEYLQTLAVQATSRHFGRFGSHFKSSTLKKRIVMITKKKSTIFTSLKYLFVLPLVAVLFVSFTMRELPNSVIGLLEQDNSALIKGTPGEYRFTGGMFTYDQASRSLRAMGEACYLNGASAENTGTKILGEVPKFILPIPADQLKRVGSGYGNRVHPIHKTKQFHYGVDYVAEMGAPIVAIADGTVREVKRVKENEEKGYGNLVIIDHADGFSSLYGQMSEIKVKAGDRVKQGEIVGAVGSSGISTGPHLHLELMKDGERVNPKDFVNADC